MSTPSDIPVAPITERDLLEAREQERRLAESYLRQVPDLIKWTSTVAVAAVLWVADDVGGATRISLWASIASLASLILSLAVAVYTVRRVLTAWAAEWNVARQDCSFCLIKKMKALKGATGDITSTEEKQISHLVSATESAKPFAKPQAFSAWVSCHILLLVLGLVGYVVAQISHAF